MTENVDLRTIHWGDHRALRRGPYALGSYWAKANPEMFLALYRDWRDDEVTRRESWTK